MHIDWSYEFKLAQEFLRSAVTAAITYVAIAATQLHPTALHTYADWKAAALAIAVGAATVFATALRAKLAGSAPVAGPPAAQPGPVAPPPGA